MPKGYFSRPSTEELFWRKVVKTEKCWLWTGSVIKDGYGHFHVNRKGILAHRYSYVLHNGVIEEGLLVRHTCDIPACVNPDHLIVGTQKQNCADAVDRGRNVKGEAHGMSVLTVEKVGQIRKMLLEGLSCAKIGEVVVCSRHAVFDIKRGRTWRHQ